MPTIVKDERIPAINPIRFIPANDTLPANINTWSFDRGFFHEKRRYWQFGDKYTQKRNYDDYVDIFIHTLATEVYMRLYDEQGNEITTTYSAVGITGALVPGNVYTFGGVDYPLQGIYISFKLSDIYAMVPAQQIFFIALECVYGTVGDADSRWYISEPIFFRKGNGWAKTMLIDAKHSINKYDVLFESYSTFDHGAGLRLRYRVEADLSDEPQPAFQDTAFKDQQYAERVLDSNPYRLFDFVIGRVPKYMLDKVNRAIACDEFLIDNFRYVKDEGAAWSQVNAPEYRLHAAKIRLQEYDHDSGCDYNNSEDPAFDRFHTDWATDFGA